MSHIDRIRITSDHPNARNVEAFLNSWSEPFVQEGIEANPYIFRSTVSRLQVEILFFDSQQEGFEYGNQLFGAFSEHQKWGMNGGFLYSVTGTDEGLVGDLASHFAGKE